MTFVEREKWNWHNIIKVCESSYPWRLNSRFKKAFFSAIMNWPIETYGQQGTITKEQVTKIREIIKRYRPNENDWWIPEIIEYFYPKYLASKGGVFFTPKAYCELLSELALLNINSQLSEEKISVYDPACGTGALLITFRQYKPKCRVYGQEIHYENHLISRWILTKRGTRDYGQWGGKITYGNTLENDKTKKKFHIVLCNPPFNQYFKKEVYGTKDGNSAWIEQCLKHLKSHGVALIILPSSVLNSRSFKEKRKNLIKGNWLEAVFYDFIHHGKDTGHKFDNAQLDTCTLLLKKKEPDNKEILLINCAEKTKEEIIADYQQKKGDIVTYQELSKWNYNLTRFLLIKADQEGGTEIKKLFTHYQSQSLTQAINGSVIKLASRYFENHKAPLASIEKEGVPNKNQKYFYLVSKEKDEQRREEENQKLLQYLLKNYRWHKKFYYGAIVKHLQIKEFLQRGDFKEWQDLQNDKNTTKLCIIIGWPNLIKKPN